MYNKEKINLEFKYLSEKNVYPSHYLKVNKQSFELPNKQIKEFEIHKGGEVVVILPITKDNQVVCVTQYRVGPKLTMTELPAGFVDQGESPLQAAQRELLEETGFSGEINFVQTVYPDSYSTIKRHVYVCQNAQKLKEPNLDDSEFLKVELLSAQKFRNHLKSGKLTHLESAYLAMDFLNFL